MRFHSPTYDAYLLITTGPAPWLRTRWPALARVLSPLIARADGPAVVRTFQSTRAGSPKLGRLGWDDRSHARWTIESKSPRTLLSTEVWAPGWNPCVKRDRAPDVYLNLYNPRSVYSKSRFSSVVLLAFATSLGAEALAEARTAADAVAEALTTVVRVHRRRAWARSVSGGFTDALSDLLATGGPFEEGWELTDPAALARRVPKGWKTF